MSPRPYQLKQRRAGMDATRTRILAAARKVLAGSDAFTLEAVAESGGLTRLPEAFAQADPIVALERFVVIFCDFYSTHRLLLRRLRAMVVLGRSALGGAERDARRLQGVGVL